MATHMRPPVSKARAVGVLAIALGVAVLVLATFDGGTDDDSVTPVRPATDVSTEPTVLGEVIERSTTLPPSPPASPATFALAADDPGAVTATTAGSPTSDRPEDSTSPTLGTPVSITSPNPPRTTTTTAPTSTTTEGPTTSTTEASSTTTTETPTTTNTTT